MVDKYLEGIIYKVQPYKETSKLCFVFTRKGIRTLNARGAQKINSEYRVVTQYMNHISFLDQEKSMFSLKKAKLISSFDEIKKDFEKTKFAAFVLELCSKLILGNETHSKIYDALINFFYSRDIRINALRFCIYLIKYLGYGIQINPDGSPVKGFNISLGRIIYAKETEDTDLNIVEVTKLLQLKKTTYDKIVDISETEIQVIKDFLVKYISYHINVQIKT
jgi:DNA repair protein RecO (recombination protein O)